MLLETDEKILRSCFANGRTDEQTEPNSSDTARVFKNAPLTSMMELFAKTEED